MAILIADSGSTKTDWIVALSAKNTLQVTTQGINPFHQDSRQIADIIENELAPSLKGVDIGAIYFYGSGCRDELCPAMCQQLRQAFASASHVEVGSDMLGAARALCAHSEGVACILGTGANSCLYDGQRIVGNTPPLGYILGDEGSGAVLGRNFINALYKRALPDGLRKEFEEQQGVTMADVIRRVYREPLPNRYLASLSPFVHSHLHIGEVRTLVVDCFRLFFSRNVAPYRRQDLPVGFVGSIAKHYADVLSEAARAEGFTMGKVLGSPIEALLQYHVTQ